MHVSTGVYRGVRFLELELEAVMNRPTWVLGSVRPSARVLHALNCCAAFQPILKDY